MPSQRRMNRMVVDVVESPKCVRLATRRSGHEIVQVSFILKLTDIEGTIVEFLQIFFLFLNRK